MHKTTVELIRRMFKKEKKCLRVMGIDFDSKIDEVCTAERDFERTAEQFNGTD